MHPAPFILLSLLYLLYLFISLVYPRKPFLSRGKVFAIGFPMFFLAVIVQALVTSLDEENSVGVAGPAAAVAEQPAADPGKDPIPEAVPATAPPVAAAPVQALAPAVVGLTHFHDGLGKQVTYSQPRTSLMKRTDFDADAWTIQSDTAEVLCFADGNNAVFVLLDDAYVAANGKARQFVDHAKGDGIKLADGSLMSVNEPDVAKQGVLISEAAKVGLALCGQKDLDETAAAVRQAAGEGDVSAEKKAIYLEAAVGMVGAEICGYTFNPAALVGYLTNKGIDLSNLRQDLLPYMVIAKGILEGSSKRTCEEDFLPKYGQAGLGFVTEG
jgi:hypothetical protein